MGSHSMKQLLLISLLLPLLPCRGPPQTRPPPACAVLISGGGLETGDWQLGGEIRLEQPLTERLQVSTIAVTRGCSVTATLADNTTQIVHSSSCSASGEELYEVIDKHKDPLGENIRSLHCECHVTCIPSGG